MCLHVQRGRDPGDDAAYVVSGQPERGEQLERDPRRCVQGGAAVVVDVQGRPLLGQHLPIGGGDADADVVVPEVDTDHDSTRWDRHQEGRRAAASSALATRLEHVLGDQVIVQQILGGFGDGAA
jgi:hypothetical protein